MQSIFSPNSRNIFFISLLIVFGLLSFAVLSKFLIVLALAYVCAILVLPVHTKIRTFISKRKFLSQGSSAIASAVTVLLLIVLIITPFTIVLSKILSDAQGFYTQVTEQGTGDLSTKVEQLIQPYVPNANLKFEEIAAGISGFVVDNLGAFFSGTFDLVLKAFLFLIALFYFLKDRDHFGQLYKRITPLKENDDVKIFSSLKIAVRSILIGSLVVALAQGLVSGLGFTIFGVPNPFFWGAVAGMFALVPGVGPAIIWIPAATYLYVTGGEGSVAWIGQLVWGIVAVGLIDNVLGPKMINKGIQIHPLFILLSVIGGIALFGPEGFLFGPLVLSVFIALIDVWKTKES